MFSSSTPYTTLAHQRVVMFHTECMVLSKLVDHIDMSVVPDIHLHLSGVKEREVEVFCIETRAWGKLIKKTLQTYHPIHVGYYLEARSQP